MGLQLFKDLPTTNGDLVSIENLPIIVTPSEAFHHAKAVLTEMVRQAGQLANLIQTDEQYDEAIRILQTVKRFKKDLESGVKPSKDSLNRAKDQLMEFIHELDVPAERLEKALSAETGRYFQDRERRRREEEERLRREAELERQRLQREADLNALRAEINLAKREADNAEQRGQGETAKEIRTCLKRFNALEAAPGGYRNPLQDATEAHQAVALALQREQARIAGEKARQEGDKRAAKQIEKAAEKLKAPEVAPVISERVEAAPVVIPKAGLSKAKGGYVKETWRVKEVHDAHAARAWMANSAAPLCDHEISRLNEYANRLGPAAKVQGVTFEKTVKTAGVRA